MTTAVLKSQNASLEQRARAIRDILLTTVQTSWNPPDHLKGDGELQKRALGDMGDTVLQFLPSSVTPELLNIYLTKAKRSLLAEHRYTSWPKPAEVARHVREAFLGFDRPKSPPLPKPKERPPYVPIEELPDDKLRSFHEATLANIRDVEAKPCKSAGMDKAIRQMLTSTRERIEREMDKRGLTRAAA